MRAKLIILSVSFFLFGAVSVNAETKNAELTSYSSNLHGFNDEFCALLKNVPPKKYPDPGTRSLMYDRTAGSAYDGGPGDKLQYLSSLRSAISIDSFGGGYFTVRFSGRGAAESWSEGNGVRCVMERAGKPQYLPNAVLGQHDEASKLHAVLSNYGGYYSTSGVTFYADQAQTAWVNFRPVMTGSQFDWIRVSICGKFE